MNHNKQPNVSQRQRDDISLKELVVKMDRMFRYLLSKWVLILAVGLICGTLALAYSLTRRTNYTAKLSFILDDQGGAGSNLGAAASIAAQFGFNLSGLGSSGGFFQGDNIIEFLRSRSMIDKTLLSEVQLAGKKDLLVNRYVAYNKLREAWADNPHLVDFQFKDTVGVYLQDSLMAEFYKSILNQNLVIGKPDKKYNIISAEMKTPDEVFSKIFVEKLIENASDFYIQTRTQKAAENLAVLTHQADSVRRELNEAIGGVAAATEANPNPNRALQRLQVPGQLHTVDVQANTAILIELVKNQELAKITLRNDKPVIQVLDRPIRPLEDDRIGVVKAIFIGGILGCFLTCLVLVVRRIYRQIMGADLS